LQQFEVDVLPALSTANVRTLLRAVMPLPQLTPAEAEAQVAKYLVNFQRQASYREKEGTIFGIIIMLSQCCRDTFYLN